MFKIEGEFTTAVVFADSEHITSDTISQIYTLVNHPAITQDVAIMPDAHPASGSVVGFAMRLGRRVPPQIIGGDIGCGVRAVSLGTTDLTGDDSERERLVREAVPMGRNKHSRSSARSLEEFDFGTVSRQYSAFKNKYREQQEQDLPRPPFDFDGYGMQYVTQLLDRIELGQDTVEKEVGTLGSGNHFVEFGQSVKTDEMWCSVHTGSRHLGKAVAEYWSSEAQNTANGISWLEGDNAHGYFIDMVFAQQYARWNRAVIIDNICQALGHDAVRRIECAHNYIDFSDLVMRKGAIPARDEQDVLIPLNMAEGILVGRGKGNADYLQTAPHGAGRSLSRREAKDEISLDEFSSAMEDVYTESVKESMKNEAPQAYKESTYIVDAIGPTVRLTDHILPVHNLKGYE